MMTLHTLYAGSGYTYLTDSVASGDRELQPGQSLANYYSSDKGTPAGQWTGAGAQRLGVTGEVTEAHMLALFGEGIHPKADEIIAQEINNGRGARQALRSAKIGRVFSSNIKDGDPMIATIEERIRLERAKNDGLLSAEKRREVVLSVASKEWEQRFPGEQATDKQLVQWAARIKREQGEAVAGFDLVLLRRSPLLPCGELVMMSYVMLFLPLTMKQYLRLCRGLKATWPSHVRDKVVYYALKVTV